MILRKALQMGTVLEPQELIEAEYSVSGQVLLKAAVKTGSACRIFTADELDELSGYLPAGGTDELIRLGLRAGWKPAAGDIIKLHYIADKETVVCAIRAVEDQLSDLELVRIGNFIGDEAVKETLMKRRKRVTDALETILSAFSDKPKRAPLSNAQKIAAILGMEEEKRKGKR